MVLVFLVTFLHTRFLTHFFCIMTLVFLVTFSDTRFLFLRKFFIIFFFIFKFFLLFFLIIYFTIFFEIHYFHLPQKLKLFSSFFVSLRTFSLRKKPLPQTLRVYPLPFPRGSNGPMYIPKNVF